MKGRRRENWLGEGEERMGERDERWGRRAEDWLRRWRGEKEGGEERWRRRREDTDSCESDAAEELLPLYPGKHRTTDRDVGPSKRCKYDENYIDLGFTYIGSSAFPQQQCVICATVLSHNSMKASL